MGVAQTTGSRTGVRRSAERTFQVWRMGPDGSHKSSIETVSQERTSHEIVLQSSQLPRRPIGEDHVEADGSRLIGYARVSSSDQETHLQLAALRSAGCDLIFEEKISGTKRDRPALS